MKRPVPVLLLAIAVFVSGLFCYSLPILAQGNIRLGRTKVTPKLTYKGEYNDNIYIERDNTKSDYINTLTPALRLSYEGKPGNYIKAGYEVDLVQYNDYDENNYQRHKVSGRLAFTSPRGFFLKLREKYTDTADPYGSFELYKEGEKTKRQNNTFGGSVGYKFSNRVTVEGEYKNFAEEYDLLADQWQDKEDHTCGIKFYYRFLPKTSVIAEYRRTERKYPSQGSSSDNDKGATGNTSEDYKTDNYLIGLRWDPTAKMNGALKFGYGEKNYDNDRDWNNNQYADKETWVAETNLTYRASEKTKLRAKITRSIKESTSTTSNYYTDTTLGFGINQALAYRVYFDLGFDYNMAEYNAYGDAGNRDDKTFSSTMELDYRIQPWLSTGLEYAYKRRYSSSGFEDKDYTNHQWTATVKAEF